LHACNETIEQCSSPHSPHPRSAATHLRPSTHSAPSTGRRRPAACTITQRRMELTPPQARRGASLQVLTASRASRSLASWGPRRVSASACGRASCEHLSRATTEHQQLRGLPLRPLDVAQLQRRSQHHPSDADTTPQCPLPHAICCSPSMTLLIGGCKCGHQLSSWFHRWRMRLLDLVHWAEQRAVALTPRRCSCRQSTAAGPAAPRWSPVDCLCLMCTTQALAITLPAVQFIAVITAPRGDESTAVPSSLSPPADPSTLVDALLIRGPNDDAASGDRAAGGEGTDTSVSTSTAGRPT
jgi:hypothetical protein